MSRFSSHDIQYNKIPLPFIENREERYLIDITGNWIPEADIIYYGLLSSPESEDFYKLRNMTSVDPKKLYYDLAFYEATDIIRYLYSPDDTLADIDADTLIHYLAVAVKHYNYMPCNEIMMRHAILESTFQTFVKDVTLVYPWEIRQIDLFYLSKIIPKKIRSKINTVTGDILEIMAENQGDPYTSIVTNSLDAVTEMITDRDKYKSHEAFILLRNHSQNTEMKKVIIDGKDEIDFDEIGTRDILSQIIDMKTGFPTCKIRFARYEPVLFADAMPKPNMSPYVF